ncbi:OPA3-domain-containing protein [Sistotremastrum suecicum HHB10207 ss-3]|uniref:OPA3-domain-containing protein n=1 Tax=Sistotremastrum suecicum HHB10207 ss-3 TaxID=1314776 RepID=A0A166C959_9AGAM|nr:OPA3-domain-containing protein [Sistotremastrum suecicum HHB10207 ss-3]
MATVKLATLVIRTIAKPISSSIKSQARQHETFRNFCVSLAQTMYRAEVVLRTRLLGEPRKAIRPLNEHAAIESGANALAEGFLFSVAAALVLGETWRSSRNETKRRDDVTDRLTELEDRMDNARLDLESVVVVWEERWREEREKNARLQATIDGLADIGLKNGWKHILDFSSHHPIPSGSDSGPQPKAPSNSSTSSSHILSALSSLPSHDTSTPPVSSKS